MTSASARTAPERIFKSMLLVNSKSCTTTVFAMYCGAYSVRLFNALLASTQICVYLLHAKVYMEMAFKVRSMMVEQVLPCIRSGLRGTARMFESVPRRAFSGSSGTYNVRASELARDRRLKTLNATVCFLDDTQHSFQIELCSTFKPFNFRSDQKVNLLLDMVFQHLELIEKDYFGLQFSENGSIPNSNNSDSMRWLDPLKPVKKQLRGEK
ncbi:unnamed protein product [Timema podura]|uniref:FERM domain-containing protein n=1 Tax=Timema podura TaxID=61482 RepID=A0ABN7NSB4_TIMPD|nr:unnamed protein product [Timema podura]